MEDLCLSTQPLDSAGTPIFSQVLKVSYVPPSTSSVIFAIDYLYDSVMKDGNNYPYSTIKDNIRFGNVVLGKFPIQNTTSTYYQNVLFFNNEPNIESSLKDMFPDFHYEGTEDPIHYPSSSVKQNEHYTYALYTHHSSLVQLTMKGSDFELFLSGVSLIGRTGTNKTYSKEIKGLSGGPALLEFRHLPDSKVACYVNGQFIEEVRIPSDISSVVAYNNQLYHVAAFVYPSSSYTNYWGPNSLDKLENRTYFWGGCNGFYKHSMGFVKENVDGTYIFNNPQGVRSLYDTFFQSLMNTHFEYGTRESEGLFEWCMRVPGLCYSGLRTKCKDLTENILSLWPPLVKWCGCHLPSIEYQNEAEKYGIPRACQPICRPDTVIPAVEGNGFRFETCKLETCLINTKALRLLDSEISNIDFTNICGDCKDCSCNLESNSILISTSFLHKLVQGNACSSNKTTCQKQLPDGSWVPVTCSTGKQEKTKPANNQGVNKNEIEFMVTIGLAALVIFGIIFLGIAMIKPYYAQPISLNLGEIDHVIGTKKFP